MPSCQSTEALASRIEFTRTAYRKLTDLRRRELRLESSDCVSLYVGYGYAHNKKIRRNC